MGAAAALKKYLGQIIGTAGLFHRNANDDPIPTGEAAPLPVTVKGSNVTLPVTAATLTAAPIHGAKTVTSTAASIFAGAARLANRRYMIIYNESANTVYIGGSGVTTANGMPILPGDYRVLSIDPTQDFGIYAIAGANSAVRVEEGK